VKNIQDLSDQILFQVINKGQDVEWNFYALRVMIMRLRLKLSVSNNDEKAAQQCFTELRELFRKSENIPSAKKDLQVIVERFSEQNRKVVNMAKIITITGDLGSGKSTVSNILQNRLYYDYIYTGKIQREIANRYQMTTLELNRYAETHPEIDEEIDATFKALNDSNELIVDSRLAWFFIQKSYKVYLKTSVAVAANRISNDRKRKNEKYLSKEEAIRDIISRKESENKRYLELYGVDCSDLSNFDLMIDTTFITPEKVADIILAGYMAWLDYYLSIS